MKDRGFFDKIRRFHRKLWSQKIIPNLVTNGARIFFYRAVGFKGISRKAFIGMHCYLDDLEPKMFVVEDNATISYGVYFSCHGKNQGHYPITIKSGAYIGMRSTILSHDPNGLVIYKNSVLGAHSFLNKSIPEGEMWAGCPAKRIK